MSDFQNQKTVTGRKIHLCEQCGSAIAIGEKHTAIIGSYCGDFYDYRVHFECDAAAHAYAELCGLYGEEWPWFQHQDDEPEDWRWMLKEHPIVAKRLGWDERLKEWDDDDSEPSTTEVSPPDHLRPGLMEGEGSNPSSDRKDRNSAGRDGLIPSPAAPPQEGNPHE